MHKLLNFKDIALEYFANFEFIILKMIPRQVSYVEEL
jgi:hypothetical protein